MKKETEKESLHEGTRDPEDRGGKTKKKRIVRFVVFLVITALISAYTVTLFSFPSGLGADCIKERFNCFYEQEDDTMDAIFIGASGIDRYWVAPQAYEDTGITVFNFTSSSLPVVTIKYMIKEALKTQDPELLIIDLRTTYKSPDGIAETFIRRVTDNMKWSENRLDCIDASLDYLRKADNEIDEDDPSWYFSFLKYHSRWAGGITTRDLVDPAPSTDYMGYAAHQPNIYKMKDLGDVEPVTDREPLDPDTEDLIVDLCEYLDTLDQEVLFIETPNAPIYDEEVRINTAKDLVASMGHEVLDCQDERIYEEMGLDFSTDFYNAGHTNIVGALKFTKWMQEYLIENYDLPDRRGDERYSAWESSYRSYSEDTAEGRAELEARIRKMK